MGRMLNDQRDLSKLKPKPTARKTRSKLVCATEAKDLPENGHEGWEKTGGLGGSPEREWANLHTSSPVHTDRRRASV